MSASLQEGVFFIRSKLHGKVIGVESTRSVVKCYTTDLSRNKIESQLFQITPAAYYPGHYHITNVATRHVLDLNDGQRTGTVLAWPNNGFRNQAWQFQSLGEQFGTYAVLNGMTGTCIDLMNNDQREGAQVIGYPYYGTSNQQWEFVGVPESVIRNPIVIPGPERVVEHIVEKKVEVEHIVEKKVEVEKLVDNPETLKKLEEMKKNFYLAMQGWAECRNA